MYLFKIFHNVPNVKGMVTQRLIAFASRGVLNVEVNKKSRNTYCLTRSTAFTQIRSKTFLPPRYPISPQIINPNVTFAYLARGNTDHQSHSGL